MVTFISIIITAVLVILAWKWYGKITENENPPTENTKPQPNPPQTNPPPQENPPPVTGEPENSEADKNDEVADTELTPPSLDKMLEALQLQKDDACTIDKDKNVAKKPSAKTENENNVL